MTIGLFIQIEDPHMWLVINGVCDAAKKHDANIIIYANPSANDHSHTDRREMEDLFCFDQEAHDGLIIAFGSEASVHYAEELWDKRFPTYLIARRCNEVPNCMNNTREVMCAAVHAMAEKGHTQIAFIGGPKDNLSAHDKLEGYKLGLNERDLPFDEQLVIPGDYTEATAWCNTSKALSAGLQFTALIASNDLGAIGAMQALNDAQINPGADVEIIGFDNIPRSRWTKPSLSTHDPHYYQMGYQACEELIKSIQKRSHMEHIVVEASPIPRSTTWESSLIEEQDHPMIGEWVENRFLYESQLQIIKSDPHAAELVQKIGSLIESPESFIQAFKELLSEVTRHGISAGALYPIVDEARRSATTPMAIHGSKMIVSLQTAVLFEEQKRRTEAAMRFNLAIYGLRALSLSAASEDLVIHTLWKSLKALDITRTGLFLLNIPSPLNTQPSPGGQWLWMDKFDASSAQGFIKQKLPCFSPAKLPLQYSIGNWIYLPIKSDREFFGYAILNAESEYNVHLPDLIRQFSTALCAARMQAALTKANAELVETSRLAGLAEMATGVLHNIGNALNSVNTNCTLLADQVKKSRMAGVSKVAMLLKENQSNIAEFLQNDSKGRQIPGYLEQLGEHLNNEHRYLNQQINELRGMIDHINQIVAAQQDYAQVSGITETIAPVELLEFAVRLGEASLERHEINVIRAYEKCPDIRVSRQKTIQILVNLIRNAKESVDEAAIRNKTLTLRIKQLSQGFVTLIIEDNGAGIAPDRIGRIFNFGFTTKAKGHGFGLHNAALAAKEMGGKLSAESDGVGQGARFILELPTT